MSTKQKNKVTKIKRNLRYLLNDSEKLEIGKQLGEAQLELVRCDDDLKRISTDFKTKITAIEAQIQALSNKITSGYEFRDIDCEVTYNTPKNGFKQCKRIDTKEIIFTEEMTQEEMQEKLELEETENN